MSDDCARSSIIPSLSADALEYLWHATIIGEPKSKANARIMRVLTSKEGKKYLAPIKSKRAHIYVDMALAQLALKRPATPILGDVVMYCDIWYATRRPDLDESLVMDCLQKAGIIKNDRQIREKHIFWHLDPQRPRAVIALARPS